MAFGKGGKSKQDEAPVQPVPWSDVRNFRITDVERPFAKKRRGQVRGMRAVRARSDDKDFPVNAPCAFFVTADSTKALPAPSNLTLFEDAACERLLCYVGEAQEADGEGHHVIRGGNHDIIGVLRRIPPRRPFRHTWRIDQPGHPEIVGRNEWTGGNQSKAEFLVSAAVKVGFEIVDSWGSENGGERASSARVLEWWSGRDRVMQSTGSEEFTLRVDWFDRRLAFAFALVGDR